MDFKVAGTSGGVTALQMDIKIDGITREIMERALEQAREGRLHILGKMGEVITQSRQELSEHAPRFTTLCQSMRRALPRYASTPKRSAT